MKIWVIGRGYPTTSNGMWGSFELEQAKLLTRNGYEVSYLALTLSFFDREDPRGLRVFEDSSVKIYAYSHFYFPGKAGIYWESFEDNCWKALFEKAEKDSGVPDVIHVHYPSMVSSINEIKKYRSRGVKLFVTEHWSRVLINTLKKHELARLQYYAKNANCFASVSEALENAVKKLVPVQVPMVVIPNIVSPLFFEACTKAQRDNDSFTFISVGRLVPLKQFDVVIKQFLTVFSGSERVKLKIVGSGSARKSLERLAEGSTQISFTGELSLADTAKEISNADALVSFSRYETFAAPVAEAWACGKPVIVSSGSGIAAFVRKENGIVVDSNDFEDLGRAMKGFTENYSTYDPESISSFAKEHFNDKAVMNKLNRMYETN